MVRWDGGPKCDADRADLAKRRGEARASSWQGRQQFQPRTRTRWRARHEGQGDAANRCDRPDANDRQARSQQAQGGSQVKRGGSACPASCLASHTTPRRQRPAFAVVRLATESQAHAPRVPLLSLWHPGPPQLQWQPLLFDFDLLAGASGSGSRQAPFQAQGARHRAGLPSSQARFEGGRGRVVQAQATIHHCQVLCGGGGGLSHAGHDGHTQIEPPPKIDTCARTRLSGRRQLQGSSGREKNRVYCRSVKMPAVITTSLEVKSGIPARASADARDARWWNGRAQRSAGWRWLLLRGCCSGSWSKCLQ
jgi:hypothetical protein